MRPHDRRRYPLQPIVKPAPKVVTAGGAGGSGSVTISSGMDASGVLSAIRLGSGGGGGGGYVGPRCNCCPVHGR